MKNILIVSIMLLGLFACNSSEEKLETNIANLVKDLKSSNELDPHKISSLIGLYEEFVTKFPNSEKAPKYLEMQAKYLGAINHYEQSIEVYQKIYDNYPNYDKRSEALFMQAFTYEVNLGDLSKAEELYKKYLIEFPDGDFADDAQFSIDNLYISPEELLEMFKAKALEQEAEI